MRFLGMWLYKIRLKGQYISRGVRGLQKAATLGIPSRHLKLHTPMFPCMGNTWGYTPIGKPMRG